MRTFDKTISLHPLSDEAVPLLQRLWDKQLAPHGAGVLAMELRDAARGHGAQTVVARRAGQIAGVAGWVTLGVPQDGCAYGAPLVAVDQEVAQCLVDAVRDKVDGERLRISCYRGEPHKRAALLASGFTPLFEFVRFARALPLPEAPLPRGLHVLSPGSFDWPRLQRCYAEVFANVPNAPVPDVDTMKEEWLEGDADATLALVDETGEYQGFVMVAGDEVEALGVRGAWRGRGVADALYAMVSRALAAQGREELRTLVASVNTASMRLHERLGFSEYAPRTEVFEFRRRDGAAANR